MKTIKLFGTAFAAAILGITNLSGADTVTVAQWDFDEGDLSATTGQAMEFVGDTESVSSFVTRQIGGREAQVLSFPGATSSQGYLVRHGAAANGGGTKVNQYTLILDMMYPSSSDGVYRAILQTGDNSLADDADVLVHPLNLIGVGNFHGQIVPDQWHRVVLVFDIPMLTLTKYIDGELVGTETLGEGIDGRWALNPTFMLFTDDDDDTAPGFVNSIQFRSEVMTPEAVEELGGPTSGGIGVDDPSQIELQIVRAGENVIITAVGSSSVTLQKKDSLNDPTWEDVGSGTDTFTLPASGAEGYFRAK